MPPERLAISLYGIGADEVAAANGETITLIERSFGTGVTLVPIAFGDKPSGVEDIRRWMKGLDGGEQADSGG